MYIAPSLKVMGVGCMSGKTYTVYVYDLLGDIYLSYALGSIG